MQQRNKSHSAPPSLATFSRTVIAISLALSALPADADDTAASPDRSTAVPQERAGWIALFDGKTLDGWVTDEGNPVTLGWAVEDGMLVHTARYGNILTDREFADFELVIEWKLERGANSGVKYRLKDYDRFRLGCEYQLIDDRGYKYPLAPWQRTGALYAVYSPPRDAKPNAAGEWNAGRIVARGHRIAHWLNGRKIVEADTASDEWKHRIAHSKFSEYQGFGQNAHGPIMIQDHGGKVWFRKIAIRPIANDGANANGSGPAREME